MIGGTLRLGAGNRSLSMQGHVWNLLNLTRNETSTIATMVSDAMGLQTKPTHNRPGRRTRFTRSTRT